MKVVAYRAGLGPARATRPQKAHKNFLRATVTSLCEQEKGQPTVVLVHVGLKKFGSTQPSTSPFHLWRLTSQCIIVWASYYFSITEKLSICAASALLLLLRVTMMDRKRTLELTLFLSLRHQTNKFWAPKWQQKPWSNQTFWFKAFWDESRGAAVSVVISDKMRHARSPSSTKWFIRRSHPNMPTQTLSQNMYVLSERRKYCLNFPRSLLEKPWTEIRSITNPEKIYLKCKSSQPALKETTFKDTKTS